MKLHRLIPVALVLIGLAGCKVDTEIRLYTSDLVNAAHEGQESTVPMKVSIEVATQKMCRENGTSIAIALSRFDPSVHYLGCERRGFSDFALFSASARIVQSRHSAFTSSESLYLVRILSGVSDPKECQISSCAIGVIVALAHKLEALQQAANNAGGDFLKDQKIDSADIRIVIENDLRNEAQVQVAEAFVNNRPATHNDNTKFTLSRRQSAQIKLSDVASAVLLGGDWYFLGMVHVPDAK
jgi:hypothetical protein